MKHDEIYNQNLNAADREYLRMLNKQRKQEKGFVLRLVEGLIEILEEIKNNIEVNRKFEARRRMNG